MNKISTSLIATLILTSASGTALASYTPEINRSFAGENNFKYNVSVLIPQLIVGQAAANFNIKVSDKISVGPSAKYYAYGKYKGYELGADMKIGLGGGVFNDRVWLFNPYAEFVHSDIENSLVKKENGVQVGANLLYQWMWDSGVNMQAGVGVLYASQTPLIAIGNSHIAATATYTIGYAF